MSKREKLIARLKAKPKDFTWEEVVSVMTGFNFHEVTNSGSRRKFYHPGQDIMCNLHKPHPKNVLKAYAINELIEFLSRNDFI